MITSRFLDHWLITNDHNQEFKIWPFSKTSIIIKIRSLCHPMITIRSHGHLTTARVLIIVWSQSGVSIIQSSLILFNGHKRSLNDNHLESWSSFDYKQKFWSSYDMIMISSLDHPLITIRNHDHPMITFRCPDHPLIVIIYDQDQENWFNDHNLDYWSSNFKIQF